jgi:hypothetical protein
MVKIIISTNTPNPRIRAAIPQKNCAVPKKVRVRNAVVFKDDSLRNLRKEPVNSGYRTDRTTEIDISIKPLDSAPPGDALID